MRVRGLGTLRRATQWVRNSFVRGALILLYHRVAELPSDPQLLCVTPQHFAEHLEILRKYGQPMRLPQLAQSIRNADLPQRAVVITFDDGYYDNLYNAKPLLERYDIPATAFVATGYIGHAREFWWDELDRLLLQPRTLPETLRLSINGNPYQFELSEAAHYNEAVYGRHRSWNVLHKHDPTPRQRLYRLLHPLLRSLPEAERWRVRDALVAWASAEPIGRSTHRALSADEVICLAEGGLIEVGAHTVTHPMLSSLPATGQRAEIQGSKAYLEEILGRPVTSFAYPYGARSDYTAQTVTIVREAGFARACSRFTDVVWRGSDHYQLPRIVVQDWPGEEFARRLKGWLRE
jgi:peptidoglycan/xylan/chitin deacetylase (PgdA/CDA1 family)